MKKWIYGLLLVATLGSLPLFAHPYPIYCQEVVTTVHPCSPQPLIVQQPVSYQAPRRVVTQCGPQAQPIVVQQPVYYAPQPIVVQQPVYYATPCYQPSSVQFSVGGTRTSGRTGFGWNVSWNAPCY